MIEETQFLNLMSHRLERFKKKKRTLWEFRCPICGDSKKDPKKARAYIYEHKNKLKFKCHNCGRNLSFTQFLKQIDEDLYKQYLFHKFGQQKQDSPEPEYNYDVQEKIKRVSETQNYFKHLEGPISNLNEDHPGVEFCKQRQIPELFYDSLYYTDNYKQFINKITPEPQFKIENGGARLIIPFFDEEKNLIALQGRALQGQSIKYLTFKLAEDNPKVFGLDRIDSNKRVYILEGPIDSMFLDNAIAAAGSDLKDYEFKDHVFVFDNEPRNREQLNKVDKAIEQNHNVYIPPTWLHEKDINDLVLSGWTSDQIKCLIDSNTYKGLKARLAFNSWKKL